MSKNVYGKYDDKDMQKIAEELYERLDEGAFKEEFDISAVSDIHVKLTDKTITVTGKQSVNGVEYQPIRQFLRRYDDEYTYSILATSYLLMKLLSENGKEEEG